MTSSLHQPDLSSFYGVDAGSIRPGSFRFRHQLRGAGKATLDVTSAVQTFWWEDAGSVLTGNLTLQRPVPAQASSLPVGLGDVLALDTEWRGGWYRLWEMRAQPPQVTLPPGSVSVDVQDDLTLLDRNRRNWSFRKTAARKRGWFAHEVARAVAAREGLAVGAIATGRYVIDRLVKTNTTALGVLRDAYGLEKDKSGRRFVIRLRDGKLEVIALKRNSVLYVLKDQIQEALITQGQAANPVTVIEGTGIVVVAGKKSKKVAYTESRKSVTDKFGTIVQQKDYGRVASHADLRAKVQRDYATAVRVTRSATLTVPGVPFIRRGDGMRWETPEDGWHGAGDGLRDRSYVYATRVRHDAGPTLTTTIDIVQEDPYYAAAQAADAAARAAAAKKKAGSK